MDGLRELDVRALWLVYGGAHGAWGPFMLGLTLLGSGWAALLLLPLLRHPRTRRFASSLAVAIVAQAVLVWAIKLGVGRVRPWIVFGLPAPIGAPHDPSFPSGHAAGSFCVAAYLALVLPAASPSPSSTPTPTPTPTAWRTWRAWPSRRTWRRAAVGAVALCVASLVALSRVYLGAHFPVDVAAGALLGAAIGAAGARLHGLHVPRGSPVPRTPGPAPSHEGAGGAPSPSLEPAAKSG